MENMEAKTEDFIPPSENIYDNGFDMKPDSGKVYLKVNGKEENYVNGKEDNYVNGKLCDTEDNAEHQVKIEVEKRTLFYRVSESPPIHLSFLFALQQSVVSIPKCLFIVALIAELTCARDVEYFKAQMFSTTVFLAGICTFCQCTFGVRLPVYQGPMSQYVLPLMALKALPDWQCPSIYTYYQGDDANGTIGNMSLMNISTGIIDSEQPSYEDVHVLPKIRLFQGSLLLAGFIHMLIGLTGVLGYLMRYVGPITVVPTLLLVSIKYASVLVKFCESSWIVSFATLCPCIILAMYLDGKKMPIPVWRPGKGFEIIHYPLHQVLSILIGIAIGWSIAGILTVTNFLSADKDSVEFYSRTDTRQHVIASAPWFYVPYPGQFGPCSFSGGIFITFLVPTIVSVIDSIADYYACARTVKVPPPPAHAINRGIALEGLFSSVAGLFGAGHATTTYGGNIGIIGMTKVASRRVFQVFGAQMVFVAIIGKFTAFFVTVPYAVLGATNIIGGGAFIGLVFSNLCYVDIKSTRNMTIIGIAIMLGLMIPIWSEENIHVFDTGIQELTNTVRILMTSPNFAGMVIACFLDNTVPGTMKERGMIAWLAGGDEEDISEQDYEEGVELYEIPALTKILRQFRISKYIPIFPTFRKMD
ncbi:solute carrier family 23 member 1-like [Mizuhopecten yessoensis]|uniref:Solute carrier family 23 member 2 n=1 Tax=Mizuhopecten yessoensis TaxID=6573 RepID=A0A210QSR2_MIZYE|nr:solute carrier family 23 member 1-like [Mizuhopecten yessoensis]OWF51774.1 Solute carrier family 23 member 2 [Mizuhopecten yessoensis]